MGAAQLRSVTENRAEITVVMCKQKTYQVWFPWFPCRQKGVWSSENDLDWPVLRDLFSLRNDIENSRFRFKVNPGFVYLFRHALAGLRSSTFFKKTCMSGHNSMD